MRDVTASIIDGKAIAQQTREQVARDVEAFVRHTAGRPDRRRRVVRARPGRLPVVQVGTDRQVPVRGEATGDLLGRRIPPGHVVQHHHATPQRRLDLWWPGHVRQHLVAAVPGDELLPGGHRLVTCVHVLHAIQRGQRVVGEAGSP